MAGDSFTSPRFFTQMNSSETFTQVVLHDAQFYLQQIKNIPLGNQEEAIRRMVGDISFPLPAMFQLQLDDGLIKTSLTPCFHFINQVLMVSIKLPHLPFKGCFYLDENNRYIPCSRNRDDCEEKSLRAEVPNTHLVMRFEPNDSYPVCYILTRIDKELYKLPYPNTYNDGHVCMGDDYYNEDVANHIIQEICQYTLNYFYESHFNMDLTTNLTFTFFTWDENENYRLPNNYTDILKNGDFRISSSFFNHLLT